MFRKFRRPLKRYWAWYKSLITNPWIWVAFVKGIVVGVIIGYFVF